VVSQLKSCVYAATLWQIVVNCIIPSLRHTITGGVRTPIMLLVSLPRKTQKENRRLQTGFIYHSVEIPIAPLDEESSFADVKKKLKES
jgi:hypothetical protein